MKKPNWKLHLCNGRILWYDGYYFDKEVEPYEFEASMTLVGWSRGCSSVKFEFEDMDGTKYEMFVSDMVEACKEMVHGVISGTFGFVKKGSNYGIKLLKS